MAKNPPRGTQRIVPYLLYRDAPAATYQAVDPEGHQWFFHTHVRDVAPEDMKPPGA